MLMPVEEDEKTEGHHESKRKKKQGKAFFLMGRTAFTEVESEKLLKLFKRYCEGTGKGKGKWKMRRKKEKMEY